MMPCERFTILDWRPGDDIVKCDVCDHLESAHENPGRRRLSGGEIEATRRRLIEEMFDKQQAERREGGAAEVDAHHAPGTNSEPVATDS